VYHHLGDDIGSREAKEKREALKALIVKIMERPTRDSPVYEFLRDLQPPALPDAAFKAMLTVIEEQGDRLAEVIREGKEAMKRSDFSSAVESFELAHKIVSRKSTDDEAAAGQSELDFVVQQLALATYKGKLPSEKEALQKALTIIAKLNPDSSHDIETLGIAGAIRKRLWILELQRTHLDKAIEYYGQGFNLRKDYYNGENYALCLDLRSDLQQDADDRLYDRMTARRVRKEIVEHLGRELTAADYADRPDNLWMNATMANTLFALGRSEEAQPYEQAFMDLGPRDWQRDTYEDGKQLVLAQLNC
jgi:tetratricopeptide (TPR) repeat protein